MPHEPAMRTMGSLSLVILKEITWAGRWPSETANRLADNISWCQQGMSVVTPEEFGNSIFWNGHWSLNNEAVHVYNNERACRRVLVCIKKRGRNCAGMQRNKRNFGYTSTSLWRNKVAWLLALGYRNIQHVILSQTWWGLDGLLFIIESIQ